MDLPSKLNRNRDVSNRFQELTIMCRSIEANSEHCNASTAANTAVISTPQSEESSLWTLLAGTALLLAALAAYFNSLSCGFVFDDFGWITDNSSIRHLWPIWYVLYPPDVAVFGGRPVLNLTLAINYALGGTNAWGYHAVNLAIHVLAAWTLFGIVRRTLAGPRLRDRFGSVSTPLAFVVALVWMIHPLQTESVTYVIQRAESLMGLFYLLTLYCVIRGHSSSRPVLWSIAAVVTCLLGTATKEVTATVPIIVLLYCWIFLAGSFREAWRQRYGLYLSLASTWGVIVLLLVSTGFSAGTTGFGVEGFTPWSYLWTQPSVLVHYLRLAFWPVGLCLDYGWPPVRSVGDAILPGILVVGLLVLTIWALIKRPACGFLGAWFFVILAPTSSLIPIKDAAFEHRMYLPLAAVVTGVVISVYLGGQWFVRRKILSLATSKVAGGSLAVLAVGALAILTFHRNADYASDLSICQDTVAKVPGNDRARYNLGVALDKLERYDEAIDQYQKALTINPECTAAYNNIGTIMFGRRQYREATTYFRKALEIGSCCANYHRSLGLALAALGWMDEAIDHYQTAIKLNPNDVDVYSCLGEALANRGQFDEAIAQYQKALQIDSNNALARKDLDLALAGRKRLNDAFAQFEMVYRTGQRSAQAHNDLGRTLADLGQIDEAIDHYRTALEIKPDYADAHSNLGAVLARRGRTNEAIPHFRKALEIRPLYEEARANFLRVLSSQEQTAKTLDQRRELIRVCPKNTGLLNGTAWILATSPDSSLRNGAEAAGLAQRAVELSDGQEPAFLDTLAAAYAEAGRFTEAVQTAEKAAELATQQKKKVFADAIKARIQLFKTGAPFRQK